MNTQTTKNNYQLNVIDVNQSLKIEKKSLNGAIKLLIHLADLKPTQKTFFNSLLKDETQYKKFAENVRKTKSGGYSPFYCLQRWYAMNK